RRFLPSEITAAIDLHIPVAPPLHRASNTGVESVELAQGVRARLWRQPVRLLKLLPERRAQIRNQSRHPPLRFWRKILHHIEFPQCIPQRHIGGRHAGLPSRTLLGSAGQHRAVKPERFIEKWLLQIRRAIVHQPPPQPCLPRIERRRFDLLAIGLYEIRLFHINRNRCRNLQQRETAGRLAFASVLSKSNTVFALAAATSGLSPSSSDIFATYSRNASRIFRVGSSSRK